MTESFIVAQEPEVLNPNGPVNTPLRVNGNNLHNAVGLNFQAQLTRLFGLVLGYNNSLYSYDQNAGNNIFPNQPSQSALLDYVQHTFTVDSTWTITDTFRGVIGYKFSAVYYTSHESVENDPNTPPLNDGYPYGGPFYFPSDSRNNYSHYVYVGADETFNSDFSGSARLGLQYLDYYNSGTLSGGKFVKSGTDSLSPYVSLSLNYTYANSGALSFGFTYSHNQTEQAASAVNPGAGVTLDEASAVVYLTATQKLTPLSPNLTASASLQYQNSVFNGGPSNSQSQNFFLLGLDLAYQFNPHLSAETGYNFDVLTSDLAGFDYTRNQVFVGVKAAY